MGKLVRWIVVIAIVVAAVRFGPRLFSKPAASGAAPGAGCASAAAAASEAFGSGIGRFAPPYDQAAWDSFRGSVESAIAVAERACGAQSESCRKGREAMSSLSSLLGNVDSAVRGNGPIAGDPVREVERIDRLIDDARSAAASEK